MAGSLQYGGCGKAVVGGIKSALCFRGHKSQLVVIIAYPVRQVFFGSEGLRFLCQRPGLYLHACFFTKSAVSLITVFYGFKLLVAAP